MTKISRQVIDHEFSRIANLEENGDLEEAIQRLQRLIRSGATKAAAYAKLGGLLWKLNQLETAEQAFRTAVEKAPRWTTASLGLFHTLWEQDLQVEALDEVKRFTKLTGSDEYMEIVREINDRNRDETIAES